MKYEQVWNVYNTSIEMLLSIFCNDFWIFQAFQSAYDIVFEFTVCLSSCYTLNYTGPTGYWHYT